MKKMAAGQSIPDSVQLLLSDGSAYARRGVIVSANRQVDTSTGTIQLQALFPNPDNFLRPGQYGRVRLRRADVGGQSLVVPENALIQVQGTYALAVVGPDGKVKIQRVEVGPSAGPLRIVNAGVKAGDQVVVDGLQKVSDGATVIAQLAPPPAAPPSPPAARP